MSSLMKIKCNQRKTILPPKIIISSIKERKISCRFNKTLFSYRRITKYFLYFSKKMKMRKFKFLTLLVTSPQANMESIHDPTAKYIYFFNKRF